MSSKLERIAIPSSLPGGLKATRSSHFGRCELFTLVDVNDKEITAIEILKNPPHEENGCLGPVNLLARHGVSSLIVGGIGARPLAGFENAKITVYFGEGETVEDTVNAYLEEKISKVSFQDACGGH